MVAVALIAAAGRKSEALLTLIAVNHRAICGLVWDEMRRLVLVALAALALAAGSGCMRKPAPRPIPQGPQTAMVDTLPVPPAPPPIIAGPPVAAPPATAPGVAVPPTAAMAAAYPEPGPEAAYTLDSGDKLRVVVFGQEGLSNAYAVDAAGNITMPLIGAVRARERTTAALSGAIAERLRNGYIREPHVAVEIEAYRPFFILGEVTAPGQYPYVANMTAETAVAIAGGFTPRAEKKLVQVTRPMEGQLYRGKVPLAFPVRPGDTILVGERWF
jgi:polysaccharide export outer membrane protein